MHLFQINVKEDLQPQSFLQSSNLLRGGGSRAPHLGRSWCGVFKSGQGQVEKKYFWEYLDTNQVQDFFYNFCRERMKCRVKGKAVVEEKIWREAAKECKRTWRNFSASAKDIYPTRVQQQYFQHHTCTCSYLACQGVVSFWYDANQIWCWSINQERRIVPKGSWYFIREVIIYLGESLEGVRDQ